ncbi:hypothetical protein [Ornithinibacillus bavariensis]|uniref:hypothetical protein n=1 Tax=Ornithinibacillus bavariensis TaxID=545502 RepID=UPI000EEAFBEE|nr:hypothetical protein [Ornithinibacillus sp.]
MNIPKLYSKADLATRWDVSRQVVKNWELRHEDFPPVVIKVHNDSLPLYLEDDIKKYEQNRNLLKKADPE